MSLLELEGNDLGLDFLMKEEWEEELEKEPKFEVKDELVELGAQDKSARSSFGFNSNVSVDAKGVTVTKYVSFFKNEEGKYTPVETEPKLKLDSVKKEKQKVDRAVYFKERYKLLKEKYPEKLKEINARKREQYRKQRKKESEEDKTKRLSQRREYEQARYRNQTPEEKRAVYEKYRKNRDPNVKRIRFGIKLRKELKARGDLTDEQIDKKVEEQTKEWTENQKFQRFVRHHSRSEEQRKHDCITNYFRFQAKSKEEKERIRKQSNRYYHEVLKKDPVKLERWMKMCRGYLKNRVKEMTPEQVEREKERLAEYYKKKKATETPEQRQKTLHRYKVTQAKQKLKKRLQVEGVPQEEIKKRMDELGKEMWSQPLPPLESISVYKPKPRRNPRKQKTSLSVVTATATASPPVLARVKNLPPPPSQVNWIPEMNLPPPPVQMTSSTLPVDFVEESPCPNPDEDVDTATVLMSPTPPAFTDDLDHDHFSFLSVDPQLDEPDQKFPCPHCPLVFPSDPEFRKHLISSHPKNCWKCPKCKLVMLSSSELSEHFRAEHFAGKGKGKIERATALKTDCETVHDSGNIREKEVILRKKESLTFSCFKCTGISESQSKNQFARITHLRDHVQEKHPESFFPCPFCDLLKYSRESLNFHVKCHQK